MHDVDAHEMVAWQSRTPLLALNLKFKLPQTARLACEPWPGRLGLGPRVDGVTGSPFYTLRSDVWDPGSNPITGNNINR